FEETSLDGSADLVVAAQKEFSHCGCDALKDVAGVLPVGQIVDPSLKFTRSFVSTVRSAVFGILVNASKKISLNERTCLDAVKVGLNAIPCVTCQLVQEGINLDAVGLLDPLANQPSWNRASGSECGLN